MNITINLVIFHSIWGFSSEKKSMVNEDGFQTQVNDLAEIYDGEKQRKISRFLKN